MSSLEEWKTAPVNYEPIMERKASIMTPHYMNGNVSPQSISHNILIEIVLVSIYPINDIDI